MAFIRQFESYTFLVCLCFTASVLSDPAVARHRHSEGCANCISGDESGGDKATTLTVFWDEVRSAVKDVEEEIATKREEGKWYDKHDSRDDGSATQNTKKTKVQGSWSAVVRLSARVSRLETNMSLVLDQNQYLKSEVANLSAQMEGKGRGKRRHLRNYMEHLEESIGYVEMELDNERSKMNRYQTELSTIAVKQDELETKMAALARKITHKPLQKHNRVSTNVVATAPDVPVDETEYDYDVDFAREPKGQR